MRGCSCTEQDARDAEYVRIDVVGSVSLVVITRTRAIYRDAGDATSEQFIVGTTDQDPRGFHNTSGNTLWQNLSEFVQAAL
jgi:hypothetical protein